MGSKRKPLDLGFGSLIDSLANTMEMALIAIIIGVVAYFGYQNFS